MIEVWAPDEGLGLGWKSWVPNKELASGFEFCVLGCTSGSGLKVWDPDVGLNLG